MAVFDFDGATNTGGQFGQSAVHTSTAFTENGVSFTFTSNMNVSVFDPINNNDFDNPGIASTTAPALEFSANGTATLAIVDTDPSQQFLSNPNVQFSSYFNSGGLSVKFINTVTPNTVTVNLPAGSFFYNTAVGTYFTASAVGQFNQIVFTFANDAAHVHAINGTPACFLEGTLIETALGPKRVEDLVEGDMLVMADGGTAPMVWLGRQPVDIATANPAELFPVRIAAGALNDNLPARDLYLSPDHALLIDGILVNAGALVNGRTITQTRHMPGETFMYYHVETPGHQVLVAEGTPCETFCDFNGRDDFENAEDRADAPAIEEMPLLRVTAPRMLPERLRARLAARAETLLGRSTRAA